MFLENITLFLHLWIPKLISLLLGILGISFLIGFHEFGHFIFCKMFGIKTPTFSIGMGPQIANRKIGQTNFVISAVPMGGFVEIEPDSMYHQSWIKKIAVISGGIIFNFIFAYIALWFLFYHRLPETALTYPQHATLTINTVMPKSPAEAAGLKPGMTIIKTNIPSEKLSELSAKSLIEYITRNPFQAIQLTVADQLKKTEHTIEILIGAKERTNEDQQCSETTHHGFAGIQFTMKSFSFLEAHTLALKTTLQLTRLIFTSLSNIFTRKGFKTVGGPLMVIAQTAQGAAKGLSFFIFILVLMSINLAVLNILPLPIMDGGQALITTIESAFLKRPMNETAKNYIFIASWILIIGLLGILSIKDVLAFLF